MFGKKKGGKKEDYLEPPKPTTAFHEAYDEIGSNDLDKIEAGLDKLEKKQKKGFFSKLFGKHTVDDLDQPPELKEGLGMSIEDELKVPIAAEEDILLENDELDSELEELEVPHSDILEEKHDFLANIKNKRDKATDFAIKDGAKDVMIVQKRGFRIGNKKKKPIKKTKPRNPKPSLKIAKANIKKDMEVLNKQQSKLEKEKQRLERIKDDMHSKYKKDKSLLDKEQDAIVGRVKRLEDLKKDIRKGQEKLMKKQKELLRREKGIVRKEKELIRKEHSIDTTIKKISDFDSKLKSKKLELDLREEEVREGEALLLQEERAIIDKIKILEKDKYDLEKEQSTIIARIDILEEDKKDLAEKEKELVHLVKKMEIGKAAYERKLEQWEVKHNQQVKTEARLREEIKKLKSILKRANKLKDLEGTYARVKKRLDSTYKELEGVYHKQSEKQHVFRVDPKQRIMPNKNVKPLTKKPIITSTYQNINDLLALVASTSQLIQSNHLVQANNNVNQLMAIHNRLSDTHPRKKEVYYQILELKNKLKMLSL